MYTFVTFLLRLKINVFSDHKNLTFENFKSERVRCWRPMLEENDYTFKYVEGKKNIIADILSKYSTIEID